MIIDFLIKRLWKDSIRNILFCIILFYPLIEIIFYLKDIPLGKKCIIRIILFSYV